jgi:hypothetical protein
MQSSGSDSIYKIEEWLGVNENPEGDTGLRLGEAAAMSNFRITDNRKLQKRPGTRNITNLLYNVGIAVADTPVTVLTETIATTASFTAYPTIGISDAGGLLVLSGAPVTVDCATIASYQNYYHRDQNGVVYRLGTCDVDPGLVGGAQQYRWSKWSAVASWYAYYAQGAWTLQSSRSLTSGEYVSGYAAYGFSMWSGTYSNAGGAAGIAYGAVGTVYNASGRSVVRDTVTLDGADLIVTRHVSGALGPYDAMSYVKGASSHGYAYGPDGAYPDNGQQADPETGTLYWYDGKVDNTSYTWRFYPVSITPASGDTPVRGIWSGRIGNTEVLCAACDGRLWSLSLNALPNLVTNSSLENGSDGWTLGTCGSISPSGGKFGGRFIRAALSGAPWETPSSTLALMPDHTYYYSAWHKVFSADSVPRSLNVLAVFDAADTKIATYGGAAEEAPTDWTRSGCVFTAPATAAYGEIHVLGEAEGSVTCDASGDGYILLDLTALFSDIPTLEWCGRYIDGSGDTLTVTDPGTSVWIKKNIGPLDTSGKVFFFGFDSKLYILSGLEYKVWDGVTLETVAGYTPVTIVASPPSGGGTELERVNMLSPGRRVRFSPDGTSTLYRLPEQNLAEVRWVKSLVSGTDFVPGTDYTTDLPAGTVTFTAAPAAGTDTVEICYDVPDSQRAMLEAMTRAELYNGENDNRVFLYGDGTNKAYYSDLDYNGRPTAEYFPDLNVVSVGDSNTPLYDLLRSYNELIAFKDGSAHRIRYGQITLTGGAVTAAFYVETINKLIGGSGYGQAQLVENHPRSLDGRSVYEWVAASSGGIASDQRNALRISQKVESTIRELDFKKVMTFYDKISHEYYIVENGKAIVQNTENGAWFIYRGFPALCMIVYKDEVYYGTGDGYIRHLTDSCKNDCGREIACYWESGAESFGKNFMKKFTDEVYIVPKQEESACVSVTLLTDEMAAPEHTQTVVTGFFSFLELGFRYLSFNVSRQPKTHRKKFRAKGYTWLKLILSSVSADSSVTLLSASVKVREISKVR